MNEAEEYINSIEKSELRKMFDLYYIDDLTWYQVAQKMNEMHPKRKVKYTDDNCRKKHDRFLEKNVRSCPVKICFNVYVRKDMGLQFS